MLMPAKPRDVIEHLSEVSGIRPCLIIHTSLMRKFSPPLFQTSTSQTWSLITLPDELNLLILEIVKQGTEGADEVEDAKRREVSASPHLRALRRQGSWEAIAYFIGVAGPLQNAPESRGRWHVPWPRGHAVRRIMDLVLLISLVKASSLKHGRVTRRSDAAVL